MKMSTKLMCLSALAAAAFATVNSANAAIIGTYDLRIAGQTGTAAKTIPTPITPGAVVHLEAYLIITNNDGIATDDTMAGSSISFRQSGTMIGTFSNAARPAVFGLGSNGTAAVDALGNPMWGATSGTTTTGNMNSQNSSQIPQTSSAGVLLGTIDWTAPANIVDGTFPILNVLYFRNTSSGRASNANIVSDGVGFNGTTDASDANSVLAVGAPVTSAVPEPASLGVLALGGLALMARRRKTV